MITNYTLYIKCSLLFLWCRTIPGNLNLIPYMTYMVGDEKFSSLSQTTQVNPPTLETFITHTGSPIKLWQCIHCIVQLPLRLTGIRLHYEWSNVHLVILSSNTYNTPTLTHFNSEPISDWLDKKHMTLASSNIFCHSTYKYFCSLKLSNKLQYSFYTFYYIGHRTVYECS